MPKRIIFLSRRLHEMRIQGGFTRKDVSRALSITPATYARYELGSVGYSSKTLYTLANFYNVSVDYLLGFTNDSTTPNNIKLEKKSDTDWWETVRCRIKSNL